FFEPFTIGDIAGRLGDANHFAAPIEYRRNGQRYIDPASIFCDTYRLEMLNPLAFADFGEDLPLFVLELGRDDDRNRLADDLFRPIAKQSNGAVVPGIDAAVERLADDSVVRRFDDRSQQGATLLGSLFDLVKDLLGSP